MSRIFITGAAGFSGMHACSYYLEKGFEVYAGVRSLPHPNNQVHNIQCDLMNRDTLEEVLKTIKPRYILHLAAQNHSGRSWADPVTTINTNVIGTMNLMEAVKRTVPEAILLVVGSVIEYDPCSSSHPNHPYGLSKYIQTLLAASWATFYHLDIRIAKPSNLIGPGESDGICSLLVQKFLAYMEGEPVDFHFENMMDNRDFIDVRDAVKAYDCILQKGERNECYIVSTGLSRRFLEVVEELKRITGSTLPISTAHSQLTPEHTYENEKLANLNWQPEITLNQSLKDILAYYRELNGT
ncbi:NAD-dependent epimerase/dehydratase family protein [Bacillus sp. KH172YL63]|uniref:NAD-dependent epimerase/dehydratase family protein n=1 Tax=Bacillus sp. KH172YL63 TaxID=2709784 RepID=UPI00156740F2|nr:NAD(P)-dependent oxidoreductase [Bacillus sp. KH172YL63]